MRGRRWPWGGGCRGLASPCRGRPQKTTWEQKANFEGENIITRYYLFCEIIMPQIKRASNVHVVSPGWQGVGRVDLPHGLPSRPARRRGTFFLFHGKSQASNMNFLPNVHPSLIHFDIHFLEFKIYVCLIAKLFFMINTNGNLTPHFKYWFKHEDWMPRMSVSSRCRFRKHFASYR